MDACQRPFIASALFLFFNALIFNAAPAKSATNEDAAPVAVKRGVAQLFVDDFLIASQTRLKRALLR